MPQYKKLNKRCVIIG